ncbi:MAG: TAXI family TRAP transporter solute-binding subunit [Alphaproteobacteria bacterium]|nr:TAXI family TRAP transporter solute-binding subunit [Alphaproteobacteria bacterium]
MSALRLITERSGSMAALLAGSLALIGAAAVALTSAAAQNAGREAPQHIFFTIATGSTAGTYFPVGEAFAAIISHPAGSVRCERVGICGPTGLIAVAQASEGSVRNVALVTEGRTSSAFAQADIVHRAVAAAEAKAKADAKAGRETAADPFLNLRAMASLYPESLHLVASVGSGISELADLRGKRISIDRPGSGTNTNARLVLKAVGLKDSDVTLSFLDTDEATEQMLFGAIDAYFLMAGAPVRTVGELAALNVVTLVPIEGPGIDKLLAAEPYLTAGRIAEGTYSALPAVATLDVRAVWLVRKDADADLVHDIVRAVFAPGNRVMLDASHPAAADIRPETATLGAPVPLHPGAERYFREAGFLGAGTGGTLPQAQDAIDAVVPVAKPAAAEGTIAAPRATPRS